MQDTRGFGMANGCHNCIYHREESDYDMCPQYLCYWPHKTKGRRRAYVEAWNMCAEWEEDFLDD